MSLSGVKRTQREYRSRRLCRRCPPGAAHQIDEVKRVGGRCVASPSDVLVRTHQYELVAIKVGCPRRIHIKNGERKAALRGRRDDTIDARRGIEAQQGIIRPHRVVERMLLFDPDVGARQPGTVAEVNVPIV